ncbi:nucleotidyltransferase family protein [Rummeliibacillus suwonensis]|nr:nucleotidyltransferase family protein [Rummeliibacillus suwonensis]
MSNFENELKKIIKDDQHMMEILQAVEQLHLQDSWICAGFIRNKVWDVLHQTHTAARDIDVIYFDHQDISKETEKLLEKKLYEIVPNQPWSVKNQARMHLKNGIKPFTSSYDGVAHFPEIPTSVAIKVQNDQLEIMAPYGLEDLFQKKVKPTPGYQKGSPLHRIYVQRMKEKQWNTIWKDLIIEI